MSKQWKADTGAFFVLNTPLNAAGEGGKSRPGATYRDQCWMSVSCSYTAYMLDIVCIELEHAFHTIIPCQNNGRHNGKACFVLNTQLSATVEVGKSRQGATYQGQCWMVIYLSYMTYRLGIACIKMKYLVHTVIRCPKNRRYNGGPYLASTLHLSQLGR
jgi:hypothetical protein